MPSASIGERVGDENAARAGARLHQHAGALHLRHGQAPDSRLLQVERLQVAASTRVGSAASGDGWVAVMRVGTGSTAWTAVAAAAAATIRKRRAARHGSRRLAGTQQRQCPIGPDDAHGLMTGSAARRASRPPESVLAVVGEAHGAIACAPGNRGAVVPGVDRQQPGIVGGDGGDRPPCGRPGRGTGHPPRTGAAHGGCWGGSRRRVVELVFDGTDVRLKALQLVRQRGQGRGQGPRLIGQRRQLTQRRVGGRHGGNGQGRRRCGDRPVRRPRAQGGTAPGPSARRRRSKDPPGREADGPSGAAAQPRAACWGWGWASRPSVGPSFVPGGKDRRR